MVLCKFFVEGNCHFGVKCYNEHFDIKQLIKTDLDTAINGKQWIFSCYGPFKDKPTLKNFIEDKCFEEIRFLCYEARKHNCFDHFQERFIKETLHTTNKIKVLVDTPSLLEECVNIYDLPDISKATFNNEKSISNAASDFCEITVSNVFGQQQKHTSIFREEPSEQIVGNIGQTTKQIQQQGSVNLFGQAMYSAQQYPVNFGHSNVTSDNLFGQSTKEKELAQVSHIIHPFTAFGIFAFSQNESLQKLKPHGDHFSYSSYSEMHDLSINDIEAFNASEFAPGRLPFSPPLYDFIK